MGNMTSIDMGILFVVLLLVLVGHNDNSTCPKRSCTVIVILFCQGWKAAPEPGRGREVLEVSADTHTRPSTSLAQSECILTGDPEILSVKGISEPHEDTQQQTLNSIMTCSVVSWKFMKTDICGRFEDATPWLSDQIVWRTNLRV